MNRIKEHIVSNGHSEKDIDIRHNPTPHQRGNSECGVYSINFILSLLNGDTFEDICNSKTPDKEVNKLRTVLFRNVNF